MVLITEEERIMTNTTRALTQEIRDKKAWDANTKNAVDAYISGNQTRVLACEAFRVHSSTLIRHVEAKRNGTKVKRSKPKIISDEAKGSKTTWYNPQEEIPIIKFYCSDFRV
jgi:hypothetical protein